MTSFYYYDQNPFHFFSYVNARGVEFLQTVSKFIKKKKIISYILHKTSN